MRLLLIISLLTTFHPFDKDVQKAVHFLEKEKEVIARVKKVVNTTNNEPLAVVFPELIRWSAFKDIFETTALEILYVQKGTKGADCSIGPFQMKPCFAEDMEDFVAKNECLKDFNYLIINAPSDKAARKIRVARLVQLEWQLHYAYVYWKIANEIVFEGRSFKDKKEKIRFLATAYNCGFRRPQKQIENRLNKATFPFGSQYKGAQVAYGDLAVEFLEKHLKKFN